MEEKNTRPLYTNRGALHTKENGLRSLVDWVEGTLKNVDFNQVITDVLDLNLSDFKLMDYGQLGYREVRKFGNITVFSDGGPNNGVHFRLSGQGCRDYEQLGKNTWKELCQMVLALDGRFSRIDLALDDFDGHFKLPTIVRKIKKGELVSKFKTARRVESIDIKDGGDRGQTIYYGSAQSKIQIRMYDKLKEREGQGKEVDPELKAWIRTELQLRDQRANAIAELIALGDGSEFVLGQAIKGILLQYLRFVVKPKDSKDSNKSRWSTAPFWDKFLGDVEKLSLTDVAPDRTIERAVGWIEKQVSPSLAAIYKAFNYDDQKILEFVRNGLPRLKKKEEAMIVRFHLENPFIMEQYHRDQVEKAERKERVKALVEQRRQREKEQKKESYDDVTPYDFL